MRNPTIGQAPITCAVFGDSKPAATTDDAPPRTIGPGWGWLLPWAARNASRGIYELLGTRIAHPGYSIQQLQDAIDADLAAITVTLDPDYVLCQFGIANNGQDYETQWRDDALYIMDAFHAQWPGAKIRLMQPWRQGTDTDQLCADMETFASERSFVAVGLDERELMPGDDDGATNTVDGSHPSRAGHLVIAQAWASYLNLT